MDKPHLKEKHLLNLLKTKQKNLSILQNMFKHYFIIELQSSIFNHTILIIVQSNAFQFPGMLNKDMNEKSEGKFLTTSTYYKYIE